MDIQGLMRQAQAMQQKMQKSQEEMANKTYEGTAGGSMVKVLIGGDSVARKIEIDDSLINVEEKDILEDLLVAAFNDAKKKVDDESSQSMKSLTGGIELPPGLKL